MTGKLTQSYVSGTSSQPLLGETIGRLFDRTVARFGDRDALIVRHQNIRLTYAQMKVRVDAVAAGLVALGLKPGDAVVNVLRLLSFGDAPVVLDDIWLPGLLFKGLTAERLSDYRGPMYGLFESEFGVHMIRAEEKIRAVAADAASASLLGVDVGFPLLSVERLSLTYEDKPVELRRGLYNTSGYHYRNALS